jgi:hypothetical protein
VGDAFNDFSVPYHLTTLEFDQMIASHLTGRGIYMVNIIDGKQGDFSRAYIKTLGQVFSHVYVAPVGGELGALRRQTIVVLASQQPLDEAISRSPLNKHFISQAKLEAHMASGSPLLLIDDYVPVDNLLAPVFADSGL